MAKKKDQLGKGIRALLGDKPVDNAIKNDKAGTVKKLSNAIIEISLNQIETNPWQPRKEFDPDELQELANSIKTYGLIQPITVRRLSDNAYQLISGERRFRASKLAGLKAVPAYIRVADDQQMMEMAIVENIQRSDLNAMEVAFSYQRLIDEFDLTHDDMADRVGKDRSTITNYLRLLKLPPAAQTAIKDDNISMGHARALAAVDDLAIQISILGEVISKGLSVRATEALVRQYKQPTSKEGSASSAKALPEDYQAVQRDLSDKFGTKIGLKLQANGQGSIRIPFKDTDDLNRILEEMDLV